MPELISHIDAIARQKGRDVLFVRFGELSEHCFPLWVLSRDENPYDWRTDPNRFELISWLDARRVGWSPCGYFADENVMLGYWGDIYVDLPFDTADPSYHELASHLEYPDGSRKITGVTLCCVTYEAALSNAHHDEPGFWE